jgi:hypothetical protein
MGQASRADSMRPMGTAFEPGAAADAAGSARMVTELVRLHAALREVALPFETTGAAATRRARDEMVAQLEDYVIPRMMTIDAPLLAVVGGSTGAGKSTLVNSLVGTKVTTPGLLRPTTRSPVLVHHPDDAAWFGQDRLLPQLRRVDHPTDAPDALQLVASDRLKPGLAILDAPDVDSVEEQNRLLAAELLGAADLWLFVTSAARYADQVPWEFLKAAADRSTAVAVVLDRTPQDAVQTVATHLARMLAARGLKDSPLFIVHEGTPSDEGLLPASYVAEVRAWLDILADDAVARHSVVGQTLDGAVRALTFNVHKVADLAATQADGAVALQDSARAAYDAEGSAVTTAATDGTLLRGDVRARWQEFAAGGELLSALTRDKVAGVIKGKPQQSEELSSAIAAAVELLVLDHAERAAAAAVASWAADPTGASVLASAGSDLGRASRGLRAQAGTTVETWRSTVEGFVKDAPQRSTATALAYGTGGLTACVLVAAVSGEDPEAALATRVIEAVFGDTALVGIARAALAEAVRSLLAGEAARFSGLLDGLDLDDSAPSRLRQAARRVDDVRWAMQRPDAS